MIAFFLFHNFSSGIQARLAFSKELRHCNIITYDGQDWIAIEFDATGIITRVLDVPSGAALIRGLKTIKTLTAMIVVDIKERKRIRWKPFLVRSCNEIDRYISGIDVGLTINPSHLYRKLLAYNRKRNYEILSAWRRDDGCIRKRRAVSWRRASGRANQSESSGA